MNERRKPHGIEIGEIPGRPILSEKQPDPCVIVIFGATGDLTHRKLAPALYSLAVDNALPSSIGIIGVGRKPLSTAEFRKILRDSIEKFGRTKPSANADWTKFESSIEYVPITMGSPSGYAVLSSRLRSIDEERGTKGNRLFYLATPPDLFPVILKDLQMTGLARKMGDHETGPWSRVIIEKPIGEDLQSSQKLNTLIADILSERQTFRIDHYLGKETVQNILVFRFGNSVFEHLWNRKYIDHVEITATETIGVENRGDFYDKTGILRDMVQNHLLQVLSLCTMETPSSFSAEDVRDEKTRVLKCLQPVDVADHVVRAQYSGYKEEAGVAPTSRTPTYVAMKILIDNWRWQGVPFYLRAGKKLAKRCTEISIHFQPVPISLFKTADACQLVEPNILRIRIQPDEGISLRFVTKVPGDHLSLGNVTMRMNYASAFHRPLAEAYERLLLDCMRGDSTRFARRDAVEEAWRFITPVLVAWEKDTSGPIPTYAPDTMGPKEGDDLLTRDGKLWTSPG